MDSKTIKINNLNAWKKDIAFSTALTFRDKTFVKDLGVNGKGEWSVRHIERKTDTAYTTKTFIYATTALEYYESLQP